MLGYCQMNETEVFFISPFVNRRRFTIIMVMEIRLFVYPVYRKSRFHKKSDSSKSYYLESIWYLGRSTSSKDPVTRKIRYLERSSSWDRSGSSSDAVPRKIHFLKIFGSSLDPIPRKIRFIKWSRLPRKIWYLERSVTLENILPQKIWFFVRSGSSKDPVSQKNTVPEFLGKICFQKTIRFLERSGS